MMISFVMSVGAGVAGGQFGVNPYAITGTVFVSSFIPTGVVGLKAGINVEIWQDFIVGNLFKNNEFLKQSIDVGQFVLNGSVVHIPNAGNPSGVERNRTNLPASIKRRNDTDVVYVLDEFTTDPVAILRADEVELSYNKMSSVLGEDMTNLQDTFADWMLYNWRVEEATKKIVTTGDAIISHLDGTTGNRKAFKLVDLKKVQKAMNKDNVPKSGRYAILDSDMYDQLTTDLTATQYRDFSSNQNVAEGIVGRLYGFDIYERSSVLAATSAKAIKTPGATAVSSDVAVALFWQKDMVERAVGSVESFEKLKDPTMYGDIYSFLLRGGGRKRRADNKGVYGVFQAAA